VNNASGYNGNRNLTSPCKLKRAVRNGTCHGISFDVVRDRSGYCFVSSFLPDL
jgi:hypothetical protein